MVSQGRLTPERIVFDSLEAGWLVVSFGVTLAAISFSLAATLGEAYWREVLTSFEKVKEKAS